MHSVTIVLLHAFVVQAFADQQANQVQKSVVDKLMDTLVDKLVGKLVSIPGALTNAQTGSALRGAQSPVLRPSPTYSFASLPGDPLLKSLVASRIQKVNRGCQVHAAAASTALAPNALAANKTYMKLMYYDDPALQEKMMEPMLESEVMQMAGITKPYPGVFDPLGFTSRVPAGQMLFFRQAELKHGRICMMAFIGLIVGERHDFIPLLGEGIPQDIAPFEFAGPYIQETPMKDFWPLAFGALGVEELRAEAMRKSKNLPPGDYGWDPLGLRPKEPKAWLEAQNKEINNGRLAMLAVAGIIAAEESTGLKVIPGTDCTGFVPGLIDCGVVTGSR